MKVKTMDKILETQHLTLSCHVALLPTIGRNVQLKCCPLVNKTKEMETQEVIEVSRVRLSIFPVLSGILTRETATRAKKVIRRERKEKINDGLKWERREKNNHFGSKTRETS